MPVRSEQTKFILILLCLLIAGFLPGSARTQMYSLWGDEEMTTCAFHTTAPYQPFTIYVFLDPGADGAFAAEYKLQGPPGHFSTANVKAAFVSGATIGVPFGAPGMAAPFLSCQNALVWVWQVTCMGPDTNPDFYDLEPNDDSGNLGVAICPGSRPLVDAAVYNHFGYNDACLM